MSDREFGGNDDLSLPKATVQKIITEILPYTGTDLTFAKDARDLLIECCVEFITLISSEANEIAEKEAKKTIAAEHVVKALTDLQFHDYVGEIQGVAAEHKEQQKTRERKSNKLDNSGLTEQELLAAQQELFAAASKSFQPGEGQEQ
jgi:histone H3/H4